MVQAHRIKTVAIAGCTAVGKSDTALKLAKRFNGAVVGADSMQIYRGFDIGTGKLSPQERDGIPHYMIDIADGDEYFSAGDYAERAAAAIESIHADGKLPIIVGGTGMYLYSLLSGFNFADAPKDDGIRNALKSAAHIFGCSAMHKLLTVSDGESAAKISARDCKRIIRALEIHAVGGRVKSQATASDKPYDDLTIVLTLPRDILYDRINRRVRKMFDDGLIAETKALMRYKGCQSMQALGYKQIAAAPDEARAELEALTAQKTRNYAKRQTTYFNNMKLNKIFIDVRDYSAVETCVAKFLET